MDRRAAPPTTIVIVTDKDGRPFERPVTPAACATIEERIAFIRARHAYNDAITDCANRGFAKGIRA